ncbi:succinate dehydrogenase cytochrome b subunit [uncultured Flavobacterium sp.]|uniref:succinate dehydrogenase cytochrome b subunit n=1 Tax=uncultured Flavobacterium sp. TaxID=165435 RepID=UPI0030EE70F6|tara:strand:- start:56494 stop:57381 length:888 start_codon:yes stop_codon:yes gene_type:complete
MAKSALLKSSIAKKYWMALTGLFLCLFLAGHLAGNLQLIFGSSQDFNEYALFMTSNPAVKLLSYVTYISIIFHAIDGILLTIQNKKARPVAYAKNSPGANSGFASRNMAVLGTVILVFIVTHMINFWAKMHFDENMPLVQKEIVGQTGEKQIQLVGNKDSQMDYFQLDESGKLSKEFFENIKIQTQGQYLLEIKDVTKIVNTKDGEVIFQGYKDLHKITFDFFRDAKTGLLFTLLYVLAMLALGFHLWHGFASAFQSLGLNNPKFNAGIKFFGRAFSVVVPLLFAIIPLYIHFTK